MKRFTIKRISALLTACALFTSLACGCGKTGGKDIILYSPDNNDVQEEKISLAFFGYKADAMNLTATEAAMQGFMAENKNIIVTYEGIKGRAYWEAFDKRDEAGVLDDVFMMHHDHIVIMSPQGKLADLSELPGLENYSDLARTQFTDPDGSVYFLPTSISTYNLYINYDLLKSHGQKVPENWEEFGACCDYFAGEGTVPIIANNRNSLTTLIVSRGLFDVYQSDDVEAQLKKLNNDPTLMAKALDAGVEQTAYMLERGWFDPAEVLKTEQTSDDLDLFVKGDRPFMISGGWASSRVKAKEPGFSYGVHPYPILDDGSVLSLQADTCISVNAASGSLDAAKEFVSYLIKPDVMWDYCDSQASYTPMKDERLPTEKTLEPSNEYLTNGRIVFRNEYRLSLPMESALEKCAETLLSGGSADDARNVLLKALCE